MGDLASTVVATILFVAISVGIAVIGGIIVSLLVNFIFPISMTFRQGIALYVLCRILFSNLSSVE